MSTNLKVIELPERDPIDIPRALRRLADRIEAGEYGEALNLVYAVDCGMVRPDDCARIEVGLMGRAAELGATAHFLLACAARRLENAGLDYSVLEDTGDA